MHVILRTISSFFPHQKILFLSKVMPLKICDTSPGFAISIVSNINLNINKSNVRNIRKSFLPERVLPFWNALPISVKNSSSVNDFKINLQVFKIDYISKGVTENHHHWSVSDELISKIEGGNYLENKKKFNEYVWFNPYVAKKRFINLN